MLIALKLLACRAGLWEGADGVPPFLPTNSEEQWDDTRDYRQYNGQEILYNQANINSSRQLTINTEIIPGIIVYYQKSEDS